MKTKLTPRQINAARVKAGKPRLNFRLFHRVIKKIETTPEAYSQGVWGERDDRAPCGTVACVAGWTCLLSGSMTIKSLYRAAAIASDAPFQLARKGLGLTEEEADVLFDGVPAFNGWPESLATQWRAAGHDTRKRARVAVCYLNHIISTGRITE